MKLLAFFATLPLFAAVDGTVINKTTGKPQAAATVSLYKLTEAGPESLETVKSGADGKFVLQATPAGGPHFVQAVHEGVTYTKMMPPGTPSSNLELNVYSAQPSPGKASITQHLYLLEPTDGKLIVTENLIYENPNNYTYNEASGGSLRFYLPTDAQGKVKISATGPQSVPIEKSAQATKTPNIYGVDFPIKPGETRFQLTYELPLTNPPVFSSTVLHEGGRTRVVTPRGVSLKGEQITEVGREPATQAVIYDFNGKDLKVEISGTGSLRGPETSSNDDESPSIQEVMPRLYERIYVVVPMVIAILILGFVLVYRNSASVTQTAAPTPAAQKGKRRG